MIDLVIKICREGKILTALSLRFLFVLENSRHIFLLFAAQIIKFCTLMFFTQHSSASLFFHFHLSGERSID